MLLFFVLQIYVFTLHKMTCFVCYVFSLYNMKPTSQSKWPKGISHKVRFFSCLWVFLALVAFCFVFFGSTVVRLPLTESQRYLVYYFSIHFSFAVPFLSERAKTCDCIMKCKYFVCFNFFSIMLGSPPSFLSLLQISYGVFLCGTDMGFNSREHIVPISLKHNN